MYLCRAFSALNRMPNVGARTARPLEQGSPSPSLSPRKKPWGEERFSPGFAWLEQGPQPTLTGCSVSDLPQEGPSGVHWVPFRRYMRSETHPVSVGRGATRPSKGAPPLASPQGKKPGARSFSPGFDVGKYGSAMRSPTGFRLRLILLAGLEPLRGGPVYRQRIRRSVYSAAGQRSRGLERDVVQENIAI